MAGLFSCPPLLLALWLPRPAAAAVTFDTGNELYRYCQAKDANALVHARLEQEWELGPTSDSELLHQALGVGLPLGFLMRGEVKIVILPVVLGENDPIARESLCGSAFLKAADVEPMHQRTRPSGRVISVLAGNL